VGEVKCFDTKPFLDTAEILLQGDEAERALLVLNSVPAYYRDHQPPEILDMKARIQKAMVTAHAYMSNDMDAKVDSDVSVNLVKGLLRGKILAAEVQAYNDKGIKPHLVDVGPGEYWALLGLDKLHYRFTYEDVSMLKRTGEQAWEQVGLGHACVPKDNAPRIFVGLEIIEHLPSPKDLAIEAMRHCGGYPEHVHLSTPLYTFNGEHKQWDKDCGLPHLRAYTPQEFLDEATRVFDNHYHWQMYVSPILSLRGTRKDLPNATEHLVFE
jgi:hypothetical protein